jgi:hypothetical protein
VKHLHDAQHEIVLAVRSILWHGCGHEYRK